MNKQLVNLFIFFAFAVVATTGLIIFFLPFSMTTTGLHALMGIWFVVMIIFHLKNNFKGFVNSLKSKILIISILVTIALTVLFIWQPKPIKQLLSLSSNKGSIDSAFKIEKNEISFQYAPAENFKLSLEVRSGSGLHNFPTTQMAIWLENKSSYHIKTLHVSDATDGLSYWSWKVKEYEKAKKESELKPSKEVDALSMATPNSSFDPRDYILPERNKEEFYLLIEVNQQNDKNEFFPDQPSIVYKVEIDNKFPKYFQVLELMGYPKYEEAQKEWGLYYPDEKITTALKIVDSALLKIERK